MKNAYITAFKEEINNGCSDGFSVMVSKELTKDEKMTIKSKNKKEVNQFINTLKLEQPLESQLSTEGNYDDLDGSSKRRILALMIENQLDTPLKINSSQENWIRHPLPLMSEPNKMVAALTPMKDYERMRTAHLYRKATLHPIDRFFMQLRRKICMFERPASSITNRGRIWYLYAAYNPAMYQILGTIYRVYYNYVKTGDDGKTPAMRLGLAEKQITLEKIIYFKRS